MSFSTKVLETKRGPSLYGKLIAALFSAVDSQAGVQVLGDGGQRVITRREIDPCERAMMFERRAVVGTRRV